MVLGYNYVGLNRKEFVDEKNFDKYLLRLYKGTVRKLVEGKKYTRSGWRYCFDANYALSDTNILCCDLTLPWKAFENQLLRLSSCSRNSQYGSSSCSCVVPVSFTTKFSGVSNEFPFIVIEFLQNLQNQLFNLKGNSFTGNQLNNLFFPAMSINYSSCSIGWSLQTIWNHEISVLFQFDRSQDEVSAKGYGGTTSNLPLVLVADSGEANRNTSLGAFSDADNTRSYNQFSGKLHIHCDEKPILLGILKDLDSFIAVLSGGFFFQG
jgi:hypothetical protein